MTFVVDSKSVPGQESTVRGHVVGKKRRNKESSWDDIVINASRSQVVWAERDHPVNRILLPGSQIVWNLGT